MNAWVRASKAGNSLFSIAVLLALSLRILIPTGFMPTVSAQALVIELCSGVSGKTVTIDLGKKRPGETQQHAAENPCVFAGGLSHGLLASDELPAILPFVYGLDIFIGTASSPPETRGSGAPAPPSHNARAVRRRRWVIRARVSARARLGRGGASWLGWLRPRGVALA